MDFSDFLNSFDSLKPFWDLKLNSGNHSGPQESIFSLFRGLQLNSREKSKKEYRILSLHLSIFTLSL